MDPGSGILHAESYPILRRQRQRISWNFFDHPFHGHESGRDANSDPDSNAHSDTHSNTDSDTYCDANSASRTHAGGSHIGEFATCDARREHHDHVHRFDHTGNALNR